MFPCSVRRVRPAVQLYSNLRICSASSVVDPTAHCLSSQSRVPPILPSNIGVILGSQSISLFARSYETTSVRTYKTTSTLGTNPVPTDCSTQNGIEHTSIHSEHEFDSIADETLESLTEYFEDLPDIHEMSPDYDASFADGVLTVKLGSDFGTYVINKQTPNKQIWLSSPVSGPKRYDFFNDTWVYKRDGVTMHNLLATEMSLLLQVVIDLRACSYGNVMSL